MKLYPETDEYIANASDFAVPILEHLRQIIHEECPGVTEVIKWGFPCFEHEGMLCAMAAHKKHCSFSFWKGSIMSDPDRILGIEGKTSIGKLGKLTSLEDLPDDRILRDYIQEAMELNDLGIKIPRKKETRKDLNIPDYLMTALNKNNKALSTFEGFSYSNKKDYVEWLTEAKTEKTREKRLLQAVEWMAEGKVRNWKYIK